MMAEGLTQKSNEDLLHEFLETRDSDLKRELVLRHRNMVRMVAMQMRGVYVSFADIDDIINEGIIALMGALEKYDPSKNVKFESYASLRIRGTIIDLARKQDWVPRSVRKMAKKMDEAESVLYLSLGRFPTEKEIADHLGLNLDKYRKILGETGMYNVLSLDALVDGMNGEAVSSHIVGSFDESPGEKLQKKELKKLLQDGIEKLKENEQLVLSLYYRKELNMKEIAKVIGVSEPRVSQIHANAIRKLRCFIKGY
ncbi:sigma-70 family RNA polymerase sigma factor [Anaerovorax sp. IOR16]|uniref:sigma-70 family RNA polymerase sigma factor n=1 Tax=Anaerovorax sp. IOR16 TaxID=2773458 RepID=UPI001FD6409F|nr:FliA/WhiG family RNA polymerase sigma factor [Anaerovorax sp. IOR16]